MTYPRTTPRLHSFSSGSSDPVFGSVEAFSPKRVDHTGSEYGVQAALGHSPSALDAFSDSLSPPSFTGGGGNLESGDSALMCEGSSRANLSFSRLLRSDLRSSEEQWRFSPSSGLICSEQILRAEALQNGNPLVHQGFNPQRGLGDDPRSPGCLLPCVYPSQGQEVPPFCLERQGFPVQSSAFWPFSGPVGLHQSNKRTGDLPEVSGNQGTHVPRRLAHVSSVVPAVYGPLSAGDQHSEQARFLPTLGKILPHPVPEVHLPGHGVQHAFLLSSPHRGSLSALHGTERQPPSNGNGFSSPPTLPVRSDGVDGVSPSSGSSPQEGVSEATKCPLEPVPRCLGRASSSAGLVRSVSGSVDGSSLASVRSSDLATLSRCGAVHRCVIGRMGCPCSTFNCSGHLVSGGEELTHQCPRVRGGGSGDPSLCLLPEKEDSTVVHGQHHSCLVCEQTRRYQGTIPIHKNGAPTAPMPRSRDQPSGPPCSREAEYHCRLPQQAPLCTAHRMDSRQESSSACMGHLAQTLGGSFRHQVQPSSGSICVSGSRPRGMGSGCPIYQLEGFPRLCVPTHPYSWEGDSESQKRSSVPDSHLPALASATLVPGPPPPVALPSNISPPEQEISGAAEVQDSSRESIISQPPRMAAVRGNLGALGASNKVIELVGLAHRPGTQSVYSSHWERWLKWCEDQSVPSLQPSKIDLANFLGSLASEGKATATLRVYRAAICTTLRQLGGPSFQEDPLIRDTLKGSAILEARSPRRVPAWDLNLVLTFLKGAQFEPLNSLDLKFLTLKTTFLLALATGRRVSGVNHLSGLFKDVGLNSEGSFVLKFLPEFLAKNQAPGSPSPSLTIPQLSSTSDPPIDITLCPVRALKRYRQVTRPMRGTRRKLLLSFNKSYHKDISVATISRWIREVIKSAYAAENRVPSNPRAHEVRAWATSLAFSHSYSIIDVLQAAYWSSTSPFIRCYLRDVSIAREDGFTSLSCVAAQTSLPRN